MLTIQSEMPVMKALRVSAAIFKTISKNLAAVVLLAGDSATVAKSIN
jgi:hypothetical protein